MSRPLGIVAALSRLTLATAMIGGVIFTAHPVSAQNGPTVALTPNSSMGLVLTDPGGWTLYTWDGDQMGVSNCWDACSDTWPPYLSGADNLLAPADLPGTLTWIDRGDGTWQVGLDGWPLYYYYGDARPGDVNGSGDMGFGVQWYVMAYAPAPAAQAPASPPPAAQPPAAQPPAALPPAPQPPVANPPVMTNPPFGIQPPPGIGPIPGEPGMFPPPPMGQIPPGFSETLTANAAGNGTITLSWLGMPGIQAYRIYETLATQPQNLQVTQTVNQAAGQIVTSAVLGGLTPGAPYLVQIRAVDAAGNEMPAPASAAGGTTPPPGIGIPSPVGLAVTGSAGTSVTLSWPLVPGARSYMVLQAMTPMGPFVPSPVQATASNTITISGLQPNATYYFQVAAMDPAGNQTPPSNTVSSTTGVPTTAFATNLSIGSVTANGATVSWSGVPGAAFYQIMQSTSPNGPWATVNTSGQGTTSAALGGLMPSTSYFFELVALDAAGNQILMSAPVQASTTLGTVPVSSLMVPSPTNLSVGTTTGSTVMLTWGPSTGATTYSVLVQAAGGTFMSPANANVMGTTATVSGLAPTTMYNFQVVAMDSFGRQSPPSNTATGMTSTALANPR